MPITSLPGRGLDVSLALNYNSALWNKAGTGNRLTFDVDKSWPAPGFNLGYGHLQQQNNGGFTLVDGDGTRHELIRTNPLNAYPPEYLSTDGSFIRMVPMAIRQSPTRMARRSITARRVTTGQT